MMTKHLEDRHASSNTRSRRRLALLAGAAAIAGTLMLAGDSPIGEGQAWAIVGRPVTPGSYAGVARRTTRRTVARTAPVAYPAGTVTTMGAGCTSAGGYYRCGAATYRPYYHGPNLVYVPATP